VLTDHKVKCYTIKTSDKNGLHSEEKARRIRLSIAERPQGTFTRRLFLSEGLDADGISAQYEHGVLKLTVPVAATAKSRKVDIALGSTDDDSVVDVEATSH